MHRVRWRRRPPVLRWLSDGASLIPQVPRAVGLSVDG